MSQASAKRKRDRVGIAIRRSGFNSCSVANEFIFFVLGLAGLKFSAITLNRQLVVHSHLFFIFIFILLRCI